MSTTPLKALQREVREVNDLNGWFDRERPFSADIALLHSEVSELFAGHCAGDLENVAEELADILIRLLDTAERYGLDLETYGEVKFDTPALSPDQPLDGMMRLHGEITLMYEGHRGGQDEMILDGAIGALGNVILLASGLPTGLHDAVTAKLARNRTRGYRHGNKVE